MSANIAFTRSWQSSNVPSTAILPTFGASTVVICRRCTSLVRPRGCRMATFTRSRPAKASIAADPVSPDVAPTMVTRSSRSASTCSNSRPSNCIAMSLKASVGPWNSSCTQSPVSSCTSGATAGMVEAGVGVPAQRLEGAKGNGRADEGLDQPRREFRIRQAAHGPPVAGREVRPGLGNVEPAIFGEPRQQHAAEIAHGRLPASGYVAHEATVSRSQLVSKAGTGQQGRISSARP